MIYSVADVNEIGDLVDDYDMVFVASHAQTTLGGSLVKTPLLDWLARVNAAAFAEAEAAISALPVQENWAQSLIHRPYHLMVSDGMGLFQVSDLAAQEPDEYLVAASSHEIRTFGNVAVVWAGAFEESKFGVYLDAVDVYELTRTTIFPLLTDRFPALIESVGYDGRVPSYAAAMAELGDDNPVRNLLSKYEGRWLTPPGMGVWMTSAGDWDVGAYAGRGMDGKLRFLSSTTGRVKVGSLYTAVKEAENLGEKTVSKGYAIVPCSCGEELYVWPTNKWPHIHATCLRCNNNVRYAFMGSELWRYS